MEGRRKEKERRQDEADWPLSAVIDLCQEDLLRRPAKNAGNVAQIGCKCRDACVSSLVCVYTAAYALPSAPFPSLCRDPDERILSACKPRKI